MDPISAIILSGMLAPIVLRFLGNAATDVIATAKGKEAPSDTRWKAREARRAARGEKPEKPPGRARRWWRDSVERSNAKAAHKQAAALERLEENADQIKDRHKAKLAKREARKDWARDKIAKGAGMSWQTTKAAAQGTADVVSPARRAEKKAWTMNTAIRPSANDVAPRSPEQLAKDMLAEHTREQQAGNDSAGKGRDGGNVLQFPRNRSGDSGNEPRVDEDYPRVPKPQAPGQSTESGQAQPRQDAASGGAGAASANGGTTQRQHPGAARSHTEEAARNRSAEQDARQRSPEDEARRRMHEEFVRFYGSGPPPRRRGAQRQAQEAAPGPVKATATRLTDPPYGTVQRSAEDLAKDAEDKRTNRDGSPLVIEGRTGSDPNRTAEGRLMLPAASNEGNAVTSQISGEITDLNSTLLYFKNAGEYAGKVAGSYEGPIVQTKKLITSLKKIGSHSEVALSGLKREGFKSSASLQAPTQAFSEANALAGEMEQLLRGLTSGVERMRKLEALFKKSHSSFGTKQGAIAESMNAAKDVAKQSRYYNSQAG